MNSRGKWILALLLCGFVLLGVVTMHIIPENERKETVYLEQQKNPATMDMERCKQYESPYMGDHSKLIALFQSLPMGEKLGPFKLHSEDFSAELYYLETDWLTGEENIRTNLFYNSAAAFALIGNLEKITYYFSGAAYQATRADIEKVFPEPAQILKSGNWKTNVQDKFLDETFLKQYTDMVITKI